MMSMVLAACMALATHGEMICVADRTVLCSDQPVKDTPLCRDFMQLRSTSATGGFWVVKPGEVSR